MILGF
ncbi:hypothetical protein YPPY103_3003, partial [Yersinia pestis PY-103]